MTGHIVVVTFPASIFQSLVNGIRVARKDRLAFQLQEDRYQLCMILFGHLMFISAGLPVEGTYGGSW